MREQLEECQDETCPDQEPIAMGHEYRPSNQDVLREYEIKLRFLSRGMVISVGCKEIGFSDVMEGIKELNKYVVAPYEEQKKWNKILNQ
jgi:hypothetical protein